MAKLIGSKKYKEYKYPNNHPLKIPRVSILLDFLEALGFNDFIEGQNASLEDLLSFHTKDYIEVLIEADRCMCVPKGLSNKYSIGSFENPVSLGMWKGSLLATGSSIIALEESLKGDIGFNPAGGMHHARPSKASGFCFINDPAITINKALEKGFKKVLYIDLDAHHADGVQEFFYKSKNVFVFSVHQDPSYSYPFNMGYIDEIGEGEGKGYNMNIPVPKGLNDREFLYILETMLSYVYSKFEPDFTVLQVGVDALKDDYLSKLSLTNNAYLKAFDIIENLSSKKLVVLGGGGYNPVSVSRAWASLYLHMKKIDVKSVELTKEAKEVLINAPFEPIFEDEDLSHMYESLLDEEPKGLPLRQEIIDICLRAKALSSQFL